MMGRCDIESRSSSTVNVHGDARNMNVEPGRSKAEDTPKSIKTPELKKTTGLRFNF